MANEKHPTSNIEQPTSNKRAKEIIKCGMTGDPAMFLRSTTN